MDKKIFSEIKDNIGIVWLNRPEKKNALNDELWFGLPELVKELDLDNELTIVGHDWGSIVGWAVISRGNINIKKFVSICGGNEFPSTHIYNKLKFSFIL